MLKGESVRSITRNIAFTKRLLEDGPVPDIIGTVSGTAAARDLWQRHLNVARDAFGARVALSLVEDLPTNQAFGLLLLWQRLKAHVQGNRGALVAFVFGEGTRATPFTETENAQKPAMATFVREVSAGRVRYLPMVELALRHFVPVERYLARSGFEGLVVKWGDEVQIPARDLSGVDPLFAGADVVRFVSMRAMTDYDAMNKDWVGVDREGRVTAFIPRRPLRDMKELANRGILRREGGKIHGGINLGSIGLSHAFLDALLEEFKDEVNDPGARREERPDLDPQFFTALTVAAIDGGDAAKRARAWDEALGASEAMRKLHRDQPGILDRVRRVLERFEENHGRKVKMAAMDFGDLYWGDVGLHPRIHDFYMSLNDPGPSGEVARVMGGLTARQDGNGNLIAGETSVSPEMTVRNSVLLNATLTGRGIVDRSVLIGTRARDICAREAFDVLSTATDLSLEPRSGTYKVVSKEAIRAGAGERLTTLFLPGGPELMRVLEDTDLRDRRATYDVPILGNRISFREAHEAMGQVTPDELAARRERSEGEVLRSILAAGPPGGADQGPLG